ncbi:MAG: ATP-binding cassette domain-containing protein [Chitinivibrionales bacterium]
MNQNPTTPTPLLRIEHLKKHFGNQLVLDDINLEINKGEIMCIIGQSGGGKSVVLKHVIGLIIPDGGRIVLDNEEISSPTKKPSDFNKVRNRLGMLFQGAALFDSKNVGENIAFPLREHTHYSDEKIQSIVVEALEMVGLQQSFRLKMPSELSGGMKSRVGLARALVMKPEIMLYDEPTSALDPIMTDKINELILSLRDKLTMTSLVVTHDISSAYRIADKIAMIYEGKIIFSGTPADIRATRNPYIQQFIRGQRKLHYAVQANSVESVALDQQVNVSELKQRLADSKRGFSRRADSESAVKLLDNARFEDVLEEEIEHSFRDQEPCALAVCDIDRLGELVENQGSAFGDTVVREIGKKLFNSVRGTDFAAHLESDEFALILTKTDPANLFKTVDRIRERIGAFVIRTQKGENITVGLSFGVAMADDRSPDAETLIHNAREACSLAKTNGRNRVEVKSA